MSAKEQTPLQTHCYKSYEDVFLSSPYLHCFPLTKLVACLCSAKSTTATFCLYREAEPMANLESMLVMFLMLHSSMMMMLALSPLLLLITLLSIHIHIKSSGKLHLSHDVCNLVIGCLNVLPQLLADTVFDLAGKDVNG